MAFRKCALWLPIVLLFSVMLTPLGKISYSVAIVTFSINPPMLFAEVGERFMVNLTIVNAVDVYGWQCNVTFDPSVVRCVDATLPSDHFLAGRPEGIVGLWKFIFNQSVVVGTAILGDYAGMHGSGVLVTIEFEVLATGETVLGVDDTPGLLAWTFVSDSNLMYTRPPNLETEDGFVSNIDHPPTASFTLSPSIPVVNETITFDASASSDPDGHIVQYEWDFDDGNYINEIDPTTTHAYTTAGIYTVMLTVIDNATVTQKMMDVFNVTAVPHLWYEAHSSYSTELELKPGHDIVVTSASASPTSVTVGEAVTISVTVANHGLETETFDVVASYDGNTAATRTVDNLAPDDEESFTLTWDTTDVSPDTYVMKIDASLEGDANPANNILLDGTVSVKLAEAQFPMEYVIVGVVAVVGIGIVAFFLLRRGKSPAT